MLLVGHYYDRCTACSARVVAEFRKDAFALVSRAMADPAHLEEVAGLHELAGTNSQGDDEPESWADGSEDDFDFE